MDLGLIFSAFVANITSKAGFSFFLLSSVFLSYFNQFIPKTVQCLINDISVNILFIFMFYQTRN